MDGHGHDEAIDVRGRTGSRGDVLDWMLWERRRRADALASAIPRWNGTWIG